MIIYKTTNLINGRFYIGKDEKNDPDYLGSGKLLNQAIEKYGKSNFIKETLEECSISNINTREKYWIDKLSATERDVGYNIALGGSGGDTISKHPRKKEIALKHSIKMKGRTPSNKGVPASKETRKKISEAVSGEKNGMFGRKHSSETKKLMKEKAKRRSPVAQETREKISKANKGRKKGPMSEETKRKIGEANSGEKNGMFGRKHSSEIRDYLSKLHKNKPKSTEHKEKIKQSLKGKYYGSQNIKLKANGILYSSINECCRKTGEPLYKIRAKLKGGIYEYV